MDIIFRLPSRALNSTSWEGETAPQALMFWTASTANVDHQDKWYSDKGKVAYEPYSEELGPVDITRRSVLPKICGVE